MSGLFLRAEMGMGLVYSWVNKSSFRTAFSRAGAAMKVCFSVCI